MTIFLIYLILPLGPIWLGNPWRKTRGKRSTHVSCFQRLARLGSKRNVNIEPGNKHVTLTKLIFETYAHVKEIWLPRNEHNEGMKYEWIIILGQRGNESKKHFITEKAQMEKIYYAFFMLFFISNLCRNIFELWRLIYYLTYQAGVIHLPIHLTKSGVEMI